MMTFSKFYAAHSTLGGTVTIPDEVYEDQKGFDGQTIEVVDFWGHREKAILRGDLYDLHAPGTGDPIIELIGE